MCKDEGIINLDVETDYFVLVNILNRKIVLPWDVIYDVRKIQSWLSEMNVVNSHVYWKSNKIADDLAN